MCLALKNLVYFHVLKGAKKQHYILVYLYRADSLALLGRWRLHITVAHAACLECLLKYF